MDNSKGLTRESIDRQVRSLEWKMKHPKVTKMPFNYIVAEIMRLRRVKESLPR